MEGTPASAQAYREDGLIRKAGAGNSKEAVLKIMLYIFIIKLYNKSIFKEATTELQGGHYEA